MSQDGDESAALAQQDGAADRGQVSLGRPLYHVVPPRGWINDPCAPGYVPSTGDFTLMYQWNPYSHLWDNISWGHMRSKDLVHWTQQTEEPVFVPDQPYDQKGIFTGCLHPTSPQGGAEGLSIFYTSVPHIPIHWSQPHVRGQEGVAMATSDDGGNTWTKSDLNPVLKAEPEHLYVTGFRDPSVVPWPSLDRILGRTEGSGLYALISGGVQDLSKTETSDRTTIVNGDTYSGNVPSMEQGKQEGPRLFLYDISPTDLTSWRFLSTLGKTFPRNLIPHAWTGDFGTNWECATVFPLRHGASGIERDVCILGVEGGSLRSHVVEYRNANQGRPERAARYAHWFFPSLEREDVAAGPDSHDHCTDDAAEDGGSGDRMEEIDMKYTSGGLLDWAELYAFATFLHPDGRRIAMGWLVELDLSDELAAEKGWTGCLGLPRELGLCVLDDVVGTLGGVELQSIGSFDVVPAPEEPRASGAGGEVEEKVKGKKVITLGVQPLRELAALRGRAIAMDSAAGPEGLVMPESYELHLTASLPSADSSLTLTLRASPPSPDHSSAAASGSVETRIIYNPAASTLTIDRSRSSPAAVSLPSKGEGKVEGGGVCLQDEVAPFTLLRFADGSVEPLDLRVFVDRDVLEVFANGRVALSTRAYAPREANRVRVEVELGQGVGEGLKKLEAWEMGSIGLVRE